MTPLARLYSLCRKGGFSMIYTEEYWEHIQYTFHAYCKIVIYHAAIDAARQRHRRCYTCVSFITAPTKKSVNSMGAIGVRSVYISKIRFASCRRKWRYWRMKSAEHLSYDMIVQTCSGGSQRSKRYCPIMTAIQNTFPLWAVGYTPAP